jgi:hypothetical protein
MRRWQVSLLIVVALLAGAGVSTFASHSSIPATMTGCLVQSTGQLTKLQQGKTTPKQPCAVGETLVHVSGGDVTGIITPLGSGLTGGKTAGNMTLRVDYNLLDARYGGPAGRVTVVSATGTPSENGTALRDAIAAVTTATAASPWLIHLGPGTFDLGDTTLALPDHIHLTGSGRNVSIISSNNGYAITAGTTSIRSLSIASYSEAEWGSVAGVLVQNESLLMEEVGISASAVDAVGIYVANSTVRIHNSVIHAGGYLSQYAILDQYWNTTPSSIWVTDSEVIALIVSNGARCFGVYDNTFSHRNANCQ